MKKVIQCPCGSVIEGQDDNEVVKKAQEHAKATHGMDLSREQALAMARPAQDWQTEGPGASGALVQCAAEGKDNEGIRRRGAPHR